MTYFCRIFVNSNDFNFIDQIAHLAEGTVINRMKVHSKGSLVDVGEIHTTWAVIDVEKNDEWDEEKALQEPDGFLYYRFSLEMDLEPDVLPEHYIQSIGKLLSTLWDSNIKAIAACDFEDKLPRKGGYNFPNR